VTAAGFTSVPGRRAASSAVRRYRRLVLAVPVVLLGYLTVAWADWWLPKRVSGEVFPFFSWDLFSSPRAEGRLYTVRITTVRDPQAPAAELLGRTLEDPRGARFLRDPRFQKTARSLARAHWKRDDIGRARLARQLANFLLPLGVTSYDLLVLKYHPLRYYVGAEQAEVEVVTSFEVER
jgi:hypothetical protein